ncbi:hypothetical protein LGIHADK_01463 [Mannheimia haemolytica]
MKKIALLALFPMMLFARDPNTTQAYIEHTAQPTTTPKGSRSKNQCLFLTKLNYVLINY